MNRKIKFGAIAGMVLLFAACKKENIESTPIVDSKPNAVALQNFFNQNTNALKQNFTLNGSSGGVIVGNKGTRINFNPNTLLDMAGNPVIGNVSIELIEIYDRSTMILTNKPTMGRMSNGELAPLISGGEFYFNATQNGQQLTMASPAIAQLPTLEPTDSMGQFDGYINPETGDLTWQTTDSSQINVTEDTVGGTMLNYYTISCVDFGWVNCDYFWDNPNPKTVVTVDLPEGYSGYTAQVYLLFDDQKTMVSQLYDYDNNGLYGEYTEFPEGLPVHIIAVSYVNDKLYYAVQSATVTAGQVISISSMSEITKDALDDLIKNLP